MAEDLEEQEAPEAEDAQDADADELSAPSPSPLRIGELLLRRALISQNDLALALSEQEFNSGSAPVGRLLVRLGAIDETVLTATLAEQAGMYVVDLAREEVDPSALDRLPREAAFRLRALPLRYRDGRLLIAVAEPPIRELRREILRLSARPCDFVLADTAELSAALDRCYPHPSISPGEAAGPSNMTIDVEGAPEYTQTREAVEPLARRPKPGQSPPLHFQADGGLPFSGASARPIQPDVDVAAESVDDTHDDRVVAWLLSHAAELGATSVHLIEEASELRIRARVDDEMCDTLRLPISAGATLVQHVMLAAGLRLEEGTAQTGWLDSTHSGFGPRVRVAVAPTRAGRTLVVEGVARGSGDVTLETLGLRPDAIVGLRAAAEARRGMIVVAGTDPGTRSAVLRAIVADGEFHDCSVATIEVPFGPPLDRAIQLKAPEGPGGTARALRAALGLDADVLLVAADGDDQVLAEAIEAALGDRVVLAGVEAPDVAGAVAALCELAHPFVVAGALSFVVANTNGGAFETLAVSDAIRDLIIAGGAAEELGRAARRGATSDRGRASS